MKILSLLQPWAHLVASGAKDIENRNWPTRYRGPFLVHASRNIDVEGCRRHGLQPADLDMGGVVGIAEIVDCVTAHSSRWFEGPFGFVLRHPHTLPFVKWKGTLGLREAPKALLRRLDPSILGHYERI